MTDHHVDDLLKDLDAALSVEPSPSLAARIRAEIDREPVSRGFRWMRWAAVGATGAFAVVATAVVLWKSPGASAPAVPAAAIPPVATASIQPSPTRTSAHVPAARASRIIRAAAVPEPEVIVSPSVRLGLQQLADAMRSGRITGESFGEGAEQAEPPRLVEMKFEIPSFKVEDLSPKPPAGTAPGDGGAGGGASRDREHAGGR